MCSFQQTSCNQISWSSTDIQLPDLALSDDWIAPGRNKWIGLIILMSDNTVHAAGFYQLKFTDVCIQKIPQSCCAEAVGLNRTKLPLLSLFISSGISLFFWQIFSKIISFIYFFILSVHDFFLPMSALSSFACLKIWSNSRAETSRFLTAWKLKRASRS